MDFCDVLVDSCLCGFGFTFASRFANSAYDKVAGFFRRRRSSSSSSMNSIPAPPHPPAMYPQMPQQVHYYPPQGSMPVPASNHRMHVLE